jgi:hypothetical protein
MINCGVANMKKELESRGFQVRLEHDFHLYNWEWRGIHWLI